MAQDQVDSKQPFIIVVGNEKGGCGKTTVSMHISTSLLYDGYRISTIDVDARQRTLSRYIENRRNYIVEHNIDVPFPQHFVVNRSEEPNLDDAIKDEEARFSKCIEKASVDCDIIIIDAPGSYNTLSRLVHSYADLIITPINDSFLDLDVLGHFDANTLKLEKPGVYSEMVWEAKMQKAKRNKREIQWIVLRNRLTNIDAHNKRNMAQALENLSHRLGAFITQGLSERVIYREMFLKGITLFDVFADNVALDIRPSHIAARQEIRNLIDAIDICGRVQKQPETEIKNISSSISDNREASDNDEQIQSESEEVKSIKDQKQTFENTSEEIVQQYDDNNLEKEIEQNPNIEGSPITSLDNLGVETEQNSERQTSIQENEELRIEDPIESLDQVAVSEEDILTEDIAIDTKSQEQSEASVEENKQDNLEEKSMEEILGDMETTLKEHAENEALINLNTQENLESETSQQQEPIESLVDSSVLESQKPEVMSYDQAIEDIAIGLSDESEEQEDAIDIDAVQIHEKAQESKSIREALLTEDESNSMQEALKQAEKLLREADEFIGQNYEDDVSEKETEMDSDLLNHQPSHTEENNNTNDIDTLIPTPENESATVVGTLSPLASDTHHNESENSTNNSDEKVAS